jgi:hypothetical protein
MQYYLYKPGQQAKLYKITEAKGEVKIPSTVSHEGQDYYVGAFDSDRISGGEITKLILPNTIFRAGGDREFYNCFNGSFPKLETIEVEPNSHLLSSVDGVLYSSDYKFFYCLPGANKRTEYTVIDGVEKIGRYAFALCPNLKSIRLPKSVHTIRPYAFGSGKNLESIYIPGLLNRDHLYEAFFYMSSTATLYVPESEVEYFKTIYKGPVLPISSSDQSLGISDVNQNTGKQVEHYDLQGRRLTDKPASGVYIENGKKVVVK